MAAKLFGVATIVFAASLFVLAGHYNLEYENGVSLFLYRVTWCELMPLFPIFAPLRLLDRRPSTFRRSHA